MLGGRSFDAMMKDYIADHQNPTNKMFHLVGIPTVVVTVLLWLIAPYFDGVWLWALVLTPIGIALQLIGHRRCLVEGFDLFRVRRVTRDDKRRDGLIN